MTTFTGHGSRMSATVSPSTARKASASAFQWERTRWATSGIPASVSSGRAACSFFFFFVLFFLTVCTFTTETIRSLRARLPV